MTSFDSGIYCIQSQLSN